MSRGLKISLSIIFGLLVVFSSALYFISTQINPEMIRKISISTIEKNLKQVKAEIKEIDYTLGTSINLTIKEILLTQKKDRSKLLELKEIEVKIPLLAILTSGGIIQVQADNPKLYVVKKEGIINWIEALDSEESQTKSTNKMKTLKGQVELPRFVERSKLNFKLNNLQMLINLGEFQKSTIDVNRITVKNLNFTKSTAFEMNTSINYQLEKEQFAHTKFQVIGEIFLKELLEKNQLNISTSVKVTESSLDGLKVRIPNMKGKLKINGDLDKLSVDSNLEFSGSASVDSKLTYQKNVIDLSEFSLKLDPTEAIKLVDKELFTFPSHVNLNGSKFVVNGMAKVKLDPLVVDPKIEFKNDKKIDFDLSPGMKLENSISGKLIGQELKLDVISDILSGQVTTKVETKVDPLNMPSELEKFNPFYVDVKMADLKLSKAYLQAQLWEKPSKTQLTQENSSVIDNDPISQISFPQVIMNMDGKRIFIADQEITMSGTINAQKKIVKTDDFILRYGKGKIMTSFETTIHHTKKIFNQFSLDFNNVELQGFNAFFPPFLNELKGEFDGKTQGQVHLEKEMSYDIKAKLKGINGELKNFNLAQVLGPILSDLSLLKGKIPKTYNVSDRFEKVYVDVQATNANNLIKRFEMEGNKKESSVLASGNVSMINQKSKIDGQLYIMQSSKQMKDLTGQSKIPFRLSGLGFSITPELKYTTDRIAQMMQKRLGKQVSKKLNQEKKKLESKIKKEVTKEKQKIQKKIKKEETKIKNKLEDEIKNKLKGIKF